MMECNEYFQEFQVTALDEGNGFSELRRHLESHSKTSLQLSLTAPQEPWPERLIRFSDDSTDRQIDFNGVDAAHRSRGATFFTQ